MPTQLSTLKDRLAIYSARGKSAVDAYLKDPRFSTAVRSPELEPHEIYELADYAIALDENAGVANANRER